MKSFAVLLALFAFLVAINGQVCNDKGLEYRGLCSCESGSTGDNCEVTEIGSCILPTVLPLATQSVAEFKTDTASITANSFSFQIVSPATIKRHFSSISLNNEDNCTFPSENFVKTFDTAECKDVYTGTFSIPQIAEGCLFTKTENPLDTTLSGRVHVTAQDYIGEFRGHSISRTTSSALTVNLVLKTFVNLTTSELTVFSPINVLKAVTLQEYDSTLKQATIEITSSAQFPYKLSLPQPSQQTTAFSLGSSIEDVECVAGSGDCLQVTTITMTLTDECDFSGTYGVEWTYGCRGQGDCPVTGSPTSLAEFSIASENVCASFEVESALDGELRSYDSDSFGAERVVVVAGNPLYFKAILTADVVIESVAVVNVRLVKEGVPTSVLEDGLASEQGTRATYAPIGGVAVNEAAFSFLATYGEDVNDLFASAAEAVYTFTVEADFDVTYVTAFSRRRNTLHGAFNLSVQGVLIAPTKA